MSAHFIIIKRVLLLSFLFITAILFGSTKKAYGSGMNFFYLEKTTINVNDTMPFKCDHNDEIGKIIVDAIDVGAPTYNGGNYIGCYRIYDASAYKILYLYGDKCNDIMTILKSCIEKCHGDYSDIQKAWIMRAGFDKILGEPTVTAPLNNN